MTPDILKRYNANGLISKCNGDVSVDLFCEIDIYESEKTR